MEKQEFKRYFLCGLGRAYLELKYGDKENFRDVVLWACLHNVTINNQSDGTPDEYVYRAVRCYDDPESFLNPLIIVFHGYALDDNDDLFYYYARLLGRFAKDGFAAAEEALWRRYGDFLAQLGDPDFKRGYYGNDEDCAFCVVCQALYDCVSRDKRRKIIQDMGCLAINLCQKASYSFDWFLFYLHDSLEREQEVAEFLKEGSPAFNAFALNYSAFLALWGFHAGDSPLWSAICAALREEQIRPLTEEEEMRRAYEAIYGKSPEEDNAEYARREESRETKKSLYEYDPEVENTLDQVRKNVNRRFERFLKDEAALCKEENFDHLLECIEHYDPNISELAQEIFLGCKHKRAVRYAEQRLVVGGGEWWPIAFLINNYREKYKEILLYFIYKMTPDFEGEADWHVVIQYIVRAKEDHNVDLPVEFFFYVYENSLCRHCRARALTQLYEAGALTEEMENECYYDAYEKIREYAEKHNFHKKPV